MDSLKNNRLMIGTVVLALLLVLWAWLRHSQQQADAAGLDTEELASYLPSLETEDIVELSLKRPDDEAAVVLRRVGDSWTVTSPVEGAADDSNVNSAVDRLTEMEVKRVVSENKENHARLKVDEENGIHVVVRDESGDERLSAYIGEQSGGRTMVRKEGEDRVLAIGDSIRYSFDRELSRWRNRRVTDEDAARVVAVRFFPSEDTGFRFERNDEEAWIQSSGEAALERFDPTKVQGIVSSLAKLTASDFAALDTSADTAGITDGAARVELDIGPPKEEPEDDGPGSESLNDAEGASSETAEGETPSQPDTNESDTDEASVGEEAADPPSVVETIVLRASSTGPEDAQRYLMREGDPAVYVVGQYHADRVLVNAESFQAPEPEDDSD